MSEQDGGPAFPFPALNTLASSSGMTLRDWFAGQALVAMLSGDKCEYADLLARFAYRQADAMLAERAKK